MNAISLIWKWSRRLLPFPLSMNRPGVNLFWPNEKIEEEEDEERTNAFLPQENNEIEQSGAANESGDWDRSVDFPPGPISDFVPKNTRSISAPDMASIGIEDNEL